MSYNCIDQTEFRNIMLKILYNHSESKYKYKKVTFFWYTKDVHHLYSFVYNVHQLVTINRKGYLSSLYSIKSIINLYNS